MEPHSAATRELIQRLGETQVRTDREELYRASMDNMRYSRMPEASIHPEDEESVGIVLELANRHRIPLTARGAGSATTGTTSPETGGWVLDLSAWNQVHIDPVARMAFVQPGVTLGQLDAEAAKHGLSYPPDPGSKAYCTIGGSIATNAGGMRGAKYGVTRDYVIALEGFLPTGEFVRWGSNVRKFAAGFNLRDLWIGSEGALGIITGAVMKLLPRPAAQATCLAVFADARAAISCSQDILRQGMTPSAMEFLDAQTVGCTFSFWKRKSPHLLEELPTSLSQAANLEKPPAVLIIEVDGSASAVQAQLADILSCVDSHTNTRDSSSDPAAVESLWKLRRSCSQAMFELGPRKLNEDVVVPFEEQMELLDYVEEMHVATGLPTPTFGHAADGNFHVHIMYDDQDAAASSQAEQAIEGLMRKVVELGGAISGEHGIGLAKSPFFHLQHSEAEIQAMQKIKEALDPRGILNPGKLWHRHEPWKFPRENVRMPWDH